METTVRKQKKNLETKKPSIYSLQLHEMQDWLKEQGEPKFRAGQIFDWLYKKRVKNYEDMSNLSKGLREKLSNSFDITTLNTLVKQTSSDGTIKFLFQLYDGYSIETVLMRHEYGNSICVTTQVVAQVVEVQRALDESEERVSSLVVMGIGEPFDNYDNLMGFLRIINHEKGLHIGARHMTVSTSGIIPKIYKFAEEDLQINFAISLHAPNSELRSKLMPINRAYKLPDLMEAIKYYVNRTGRRITFEYGLFGGENDQVEHAEELAALLKGVKCHVNLIPVNYVPERDYVRTPREQIFLFEKTLKDRGVNVTIRREQGHDIDAACGQLRAKERKEETR